MEAEAEAEEAAEGGGKEVAEEADFLRLFPLLQV